MGQEEDGLVHATAFGTDETLGAGEPCRQGRAVDVDPVRVQERERGCDNDRAR
jgi:hypothetical protein